MKKNKLFALACTVVTMATVLVAGTVITKAEGASNTTIENGVHIGGVDVSGMTESEAKSAVDSYVNSLMNTTFTFVADNGTMDISASEMGISADADSAVEEAMAIGHTGNLINRFKEVTDLKKENITVSMHLGLDKQATAQAIYANSAELNIEASDATLTRVNGEFQYVPGVEGHEVNIVESVNNFNTYLSTEWDGTSRQYDLVVDVVEPRGSQEELASIKDVLGQFATNYASSAAGRATNVANGCSKVNGSIVYPGEEFSVHSAVAPLDTSNGYAMAGAYENGKVVESPGGGICQVATTLYNAVIRAELEITQRLNHSMIVSYVDPSADAAIAGDYKDLRFKNNYDTPIYIEGYCSGGIITFVVYGKETRPANRTIKFRSETLETTDKDTEYNLSSDFEAGYVNVDQTAHQGIVARLWKEVYVDGVQESSEIFNSSKYNASPKIITIGTKGASDDAISAIKKAIKSKDESAVRAAAAAAKKGDKDEDKDKDDKKKKSEDKKKEEDSTSSDNTDPVVEPDPAVDPNPEPTADPAVDPNGV